MEVSTKNMHSILATERFLASKHLFEEFLQLRAAGKVERFVDVGGSPARFSKLMIELGALDAVVIHLCPDLMVGDSRRASERSFGLTFNSEFMDFDFLPGDFVVFIHSFYYLDYVERLHLVRLVQEGQCMARLVYHKIHEPVVVYGSESIALLERDSEDGSLTLTMHVEGNSGDYNHPYPEVCFSGHESFWSWGSYALYVSNKMNEFMASPFIAGWLFQFALVFCFHLFGSNYWQSWFNPYSLYGLLIVVYMWEATMVCVRSFKAVRCTLYLDHFRVVGNTTIASIKVTSHKLLTDARFSPSQVGGSGHIVDTDLLANYKLMLCRYPNDISEVVKRRLALDIVQKLHKDYPSWLRLWLVENLCGEDGWLADIRLRWFYLRWWSAFTKFVWRTWRFLSRVYYFILFSFPNPSLKVVNLSTTCFRNDPRFDDLLVHAEEVGLHGLAAQCRERCKPKYYLRSGVVALPSWLRPVCFGNCPHNLLAALMLRTFNDIPLSTDENGFLQSCKKIGSFSPRILGVTVKSVEEYMAKFPSRRRKQLEAEYRRYNCSASELRMRAPETLYVHRGDTKHLFCDVMPKSNEVVASKYGEELVMPKPRTITCPPLSQLLLLGPYVDALAEGEKKFWDGTHYVQLGSLKVYFLAASGRNAAELNKAVLSCPEVFTHIFEGDFKHNDRSFNGTFRRAVLQSIVSAQRHNVNLPTEVSELMFACAEPLALKVRTSAGYDVVIPPSQLFTGLNITSLSNGRATQSIIASILKDQAPPGAVALVLYGGDDSLTLTNFGVDYGRLKSSVLEMGYELEGSSTVIGSPDMVKMEFYGMVPYPTGSSSPLAFGPRLSRVLSKLFLAHSVEEVTVTRFYEKLAAIRLAAPACPCLTWVYQGLLPKFPINEERKKPLVNVSLPPHDEVTLSAFMAYYGLSIDDVCEIKTTLSRLLYGGKLDCKPLRHLMAMDGYAEW
jgi:hypothetical protein